MKSNTWNVTQLLKEFAHWQCGQANEGGEENRIVNGVDAKKNEYPWMVRISIQPICFWTIHINSWIIKEIKYNFHIY